MTEQQKKQSRLAIRARQGDQQARLELWESVERLIFRMCARCYYGAEEQATRSGADFEDFRQVGWFAFLEAVEAYKPEKEFPFTSYLRYPVKTQAAALLGLRSSRRDALNYAGSLNVPLSEDDPEGAERIDFVADHNDPFENAERRVWREQLRKFLRDSLALLSMREQHVITGLYFEGRTLKEMAEIIGISPERVRQIRERGLRNIRNKRKKVLQDFREELLETEPYKGTSYRSFARSGSSSVERTVEELDSAENRWG